MDKYSVLMTFTIVVNTYTHITHNVNRATVSKKYQYGQTPRVLEVKQRGSVGP